MFCGFRAGLFGVDGWTALRDEASLDMFFADTGIKIDWTLDEEIWRVAGRPIDALHCAARKTALGLPGAFWRIF